VIVGKVWAGLEDALLVYLSTRLLRVVSPSMFLILIKLCRCPFQLD
jgi:hypothetical protein